MLTKECTLIGICPNNYYVLHKTREAGKDMDSTFIHKWGYPTLLYKYNKAPIVFQVNPGIRLDEMLLNEIPYNQKFFKGVAVSGEVG